MRLLCKGNLSVFVVVEKWGFHQDQYCRYNVLERIQVFTKVDSMKGTAEGGAPVGGSGDILPRKSLELVALGKAIFSILRQG